MGCLLALLARVALLVVWIATPLVTKAFDGAWLLPLLGVLFLPITALTYVAVYAIAGGVTGWAWLWVVLAVLFDLGTHSAGAYNNRRRVARYRPASQ